MGLILKAIKYSQYWDEPEEWHLEKFSLQRINLLVGKNATGKTRTLNIIDALANLVSGDQKLIFDSGNYIAYFNNSGVDIQYVLQYKDKRIIREELMVAGEQVLMRESEGKGSIKAVKLNSLIEFQAPDNELACVVRRDSIQHPFFEDLYQWGKQIRHFHFGRELGRTTLTIFNKRQKNGGFNLKDTDKAAIHLLKLGIDVFGADFIHSIIKDMERLNYSVDDIGAATVPRIQVDQVPFSDVEGIFVKEGDLYQKTFQHEMSQGMFRALSLVIQMNYAYYEKVPYCVLIDDIGEGLDFERSAMLIKIIIEKAEDSSMQVIMSTNDRFVMNNVSLEYWAVIQRLGSRCKVFNYENSKKVFDEFQFTGLSNFDFLSTEFYLSGFDK